MQEEKERLLDGVLEAHQESTADSVQTGAIFPNDQRSTRMVKLIVFLTKAIAFTIIVAAWATVGLLAWIAMVCRVIAITAFHVTTSLLSGSNVSLAGPSIEQVASMWPQGLDQIIFSFWKNKGNMEKQIQSKDWKRVAVESLYSIVFYYIPISLIFFYNDYFENYKTIFVTTIALVFVFLILAILLLLLKKGFPLLKRIFDFFTP